MKYFNALKLSSMLVVLALVLSSCGDDPASVEGEPPALPEFQQIQPDLSYFETNNPKLKTTNNFYQAKNYALGLGSVAAFGQIYMGLFSSASQIDASYDNGKWIWEYSYSAEGASATIKLTARETNNTIVWEMFLSGDDGEGTTYDNYKVIEGEVALDGSTGSWTFNNLNSETNTEEAILVTTWTKESDTNIEITTEFYGTSSSGTESYTFAQDGTVYDVTYISTSNQNNIYVHWDSEVLTGYFQVGSDAAERSCWDADFQDVNCSDVGY